jgi:glycogen operon protein
MDFTLPPTTYGESWQVLIDTAAPVEALERNAKAGDAVTLDGRSLVVLRRDF